MERKFKFSTGEFYHVYNRGNSKQAIFLSENDKIRFQKLLYVCNSVEPVVFKTIQRRSLDKIDRGETLVDIGAYCLMPNHFHLLLHEKIDGGISMFVKKVLTGYSKYFNLKNKRTGSLFEGVFKAEYVDNDDYLKYLFAYIHLNPIKIIDSKWKENGITDLEKSKKYLYEFYYSSYLDYMNFNRDESKIINKSVFPEYFEDFKEFENFINDWLSIKIIQRSIQRPSLDN